MGRFLVVSVALTLYGAVRALPLGVASRLVGFLFRHGARAFLKPSVIEANLAAAFPELGAPERRRMVSQIAANFGRSIVEVIKLPVFAAGGRGTTVTARGDLAVPFAEDNQAIYVSAHLGNWELMPLVFADRPKPMRIIYTPFNEPAIERRLAALRRTTGSIYVEKADAMRSCIAAMKAGAPVAMLVDQRVKLGVGVEFFGQETQFTRLPARLAVKFDRPIIFVEAIRVTPDTQDVHFHPPIWPRGATGAELERQMTQEMARQVEQAIRRRPADWFCNKRRWKKPPKLADAPSPATALAPRHSLARSAPEA